MKRIPLNRLTEQFEKTQDFLYQVQILDQCYSRMEKYPDEREKIEKLFFRWFQSVEHPLLKESLRAKIQSGKKEKSSKEVNHSELFQSIKQKIYSSDEQVRVQSVMEIRENIHLPEMLPLLLDALSREESKYVIATITKTLGLFNGKELISTLYHYLSHEDSRVRSNTVEGLGMLESEEKIPILYEMLKDENARVKSSCIKALVDCGEGEKCFDTLREMLILGEKPHILSSLYTLSQFEDFGSIRIITFFLEHDDEEIQKMAVESLKKVSLEKSVEVILEQLRFAPDYTIANRYILILDELLSLREFYEVSHLYFQTLKILTQRRSYKLVELFLSQRTFNEIKGILELSQNFLNCRRWLFREFLSRPIGSEEKEYLISQANLKENQEFGEEILLSIQNGTNRLKTDNPPITEIEKPKKGFKERLSAMIHKTMTLPLKSSEDRYHLAGDFLLHSLNFQENQDPVFHNLKEFIEVKIGKVWFPRLFYAGTAIPEYLIGSALNHYASGIREPEKILFLMDTSSSGLGSQGIVITDKRLWVSLGIDVFAIRLSRIESFRLECNGTDNFELFVNNEFKGVIIPFNPSELILAEEMICHILGLKSFVKWNVNNIQREYEDLILRVQEYYDLYSFKGKAWLFSQFFTGMAISLISPKIFQEVEKIKVNSGEKILALFLSNPSDLSKGYWMVTQWRFYFSLSFSEGYSHRNIYIPIAEIDSVHADPEGVLYVNSGKACLIDFQKNSELVNVNAFFMHFFQKLSTPLHIHWRKGNQKKINSYIKEFCSQAMISNLEYKKFISLKTNQIFCYPFIPEENAEKVKKLLKIEEKLQIRMIFSGGTGLNTFLITDKNIYFLKGKIPLSCINDFSLKDNELLLNHIWIMDVSLKDYEKILLEMFFKGICDENYNISREEMEALQKSQFTPENYKTLQPYLFPQEQIIYATWGVNSLKSRKFLILTELKVIVIDDKVKFFGYDEIIQVEKQKENLISAGMNYIIEGIGREVLQAATHVMGEHCNLIFEGRNFTHKLESLLIYEADLIKSICDKQFERLKNSEHKFQAIYQIHKPEEKLIALKKLLEKEVLDYEEFSFLKKKYLSELLMD